MSDNEVNVTLNVKELQFLIDAVSLWDNEMPSILKDNRIAVYKSVSEKLENAEEKLR
jgi:hypothetical protein